MTSYAVEGVSYRLFNFGMLRLSKSMMSMRWYAIVDNYTVFFC